MRWIRRSGAAALLVTFLATQPAAHASEVVLVHPPTTDAFLEEVYHRLNGELRVHGFATRQESTSVEPSLRFAQELLERTGADACLSLVSQGETIVVEIWVAAAGAAPTLFEAVSLRRTPDVPTRLAIRAVDLLKGALIRDRPAAEAPPPTPPGAAVVAGAGASMGRANSRWALEVGGALLDDPQDFGSAWGPQLAVTSDLSQRFGVAVHLAGPFFGAAHSTADAGVKLVQAFGLGELLAVLVRRGGFVLRLAAGAGGYHVRTQGTVPEQTVSLRPRRDAGWALAGAGGVDMVLPFTAHLSLVVSTRALLLLPAPRVLLGGDEHRLGQPALSLALNACWRF